MSSLVRRAVGDILFRRGTSRACGDGIAVPDGVECPHPEGHALGRVECPPRRRGPPRRKPGAAVRTDGMPEDRRGASRRAGLAAPPGLTVIVTTRSHRKEVTGVPGQESLEHQSSERRGHPSRGAMDRQAFSRRRCWRSHRQDWGYPAAAAAGCCCYCCCYCCHCLYRRRP